MIKYIHTIKFFSACLFIGFSLSGFSQETIAFSPSELIPSTDGYYIAGVDKDKNDDGSTEHYDGCADEYEDEPPFGENEYDPSLNHKETGEQQGFSYYNCMIMPTCNHKSTAIDPPVANGYIQMHACIKSGHPDSAIYSYIQTPSIANLTSIYMETSSDISINDSRQIPYNIEYSKDNGLTWEQSYLMDKVAEQGGYRVTYDGTVYQEIQEMIDASKVSPIVLRIITNDREATITGQFVKLHSLVLTAEKASKIRTIESNLLIDISIKNKKITSENNTIEVFNVMGQFIGAGNIVEVPQTGIYLIKDNKNSVQKVFIK